MKRLFFALCFMTVLFAAKAQIKAEFPEKKLYIGDRIHLCYTVYPAEDTKLLVPDAREWIRDLEALSQSLGSDRKKMGSYRFIVEGAAFDTGFVHIPAMPLVLYRESGDTPADTLYTPEKFLYIHSVLDSTAAALPLYPPLPVSPLCWWELLIILLLLTATALLLYFGLRHKNNRGNQVNEPWIPPFEKAREALAKLQKKRYPQNGEWKAFYLELTYIIREYYEAVFFVHLQELTSTELLQELGKHLEPKDLPEVQDFFRFADMVKYAKMPASEERCGRDWERVRRLIGENEDRLHKTRELEENGTETDFFSEAEEEQQK